MLDKRPKPRALRDERLEKRQNELKMKNESKRKIYTEEVITSEILTIKSQIKSLQARKSELEIKLEKVLEKRYEVHGKALSGVLKKEDLCPICHKEHNQSPPDSCWVGAHKYKERSPAIWEAFHNYLVSHRWGSLKM